jgi:hypothetical protein
MGDRDRSLLKRQRRCSRPFRNDRSPSFVDGPHATTSTLPPATKASPATKNSATTSTPWETTSACPEDGPIEWVQTGKWIIGCLEAISITAIASVWHCAETSASTCHRTLTPWSCSIKSWHKNTPFPEKVHGQQARVKMPVWLMGYVIGLKIL